MDLVKAVRAYANAHYNENGWDFLVECWSDEDILETIGNAKSEAQAIRRAGAAVRGLAERRDEVRSEIF